MKGRFFHLSHERRKWLKIFSFSMTYNHEKLKVWWKKIAKKLHTRLLVFRLQSKYDFFRIFLDKYFWILLIWTHLKLFYSIHIYKFFAEEFDVVLTSQLCTIGDPNARATIPTFWLKPNRI